MTCVFFDLLCWMMTFACGYWLGTWSAKPSDVAELPEADRLRNDLAIARIRVTMLEAELKEQQERTGRLRRALLDALQSEKMKSLEPATADDAIPPP